MSVDALKNVLLAIAGEGLAYANQTIERRDKRIAELEAEVARLRAGNSNSPEFEGIRGAAPAAGTVEKDAERYRHMRDAQWFKAGFAKTEANASAFHYGGELLDQLVDAAIEREKA